MNLNDERAAFEAYRDMKYATFKAYVADMFRYQSVLIFEGFWAQVAIAALLGILVATFRNPDRIEVQEAIDQIFPLRETFLRAAERP